MQAHMQAGTSYLRLLPKARMADVPQRAVGDAQKIPAFVK